MVEGFACYVMYKSRVLIIACKGNDFYLFIGSRYPILNLIFSLFCGVTLKKHYITVLKNVVFGYKNQRSNIEVEKVKIWQQFLISGKWYSFLIFAFCPTQIKSYIITGLVSNFFNAPCKRMTSSLQKRKHHW